MKTALSGQSISPEKLDEILRVCDDICHGDFEARIKHITTDDGVERQLCLKINEMIDRADAYLRESTACLSFVAKNQYFRRIATHGMLGDYAEAAKVSNRAADGIQEKMEMFGEMANSVSSAAADLNSNAHRLEETANSTSQKAATVAAGANEAGTNTSTVAAAAEELNAAIQEISQQVTNSARMAGDAVQLADVANGVVNGLSEQSSKIESVVALISDIAGQTNLLALNATIEAARAGEAGKGFAVVASEVKNLANQTAKATDEIKSQVSEIQNATVTAVKSIGEIGDTIRSFDEVSTAIASAVEQQGAATQEISRNVTQAAQSVTEISTNIDEVSESVAAVKGLSGEVLGVANSLSDSADKLKDVLSHVA